ncbi:MAG: hypothetical protein COV72_03540 [Candidatus Omnitrophica bacterium CG11_big_fil_rev_8_21_14_0_20_42_13]|uniref:CheW-like domain-containing protein n=1 Tax=Candidatus Ghiorseimicrobium undicola TaxID=1974746 RepID=A0A2H0LY31_9BACT|nr:MAG: hypothetical protein COV72_03540 [Candidatus Omnitrophica bacterium CG11_big_fil_rev_8_21_14_0_20_42_13]
MEDKNKITKMASAQNDASNTASSIDFYEDENRPRERRIKFVTFSLGKEWYGIEISKVKDVSMLAEVVRLPCVADYISGIVNLRGNIISVTDLRKLLGLSHAALTKNSRLLVINSREIETGIIVEDTPKVVDVELSKIDPPLEIFDQERAEYIVGVCKLEDIFFAILNVEKILSVRNR